MASPPRHHAYGSFTTARYASMARLLVPLVASIPAAIAAPLFQTKEEEELEPKPADDPSLWIYLGTAVLLVVLGGIFAGLTIALMGQDEIYLQVIATSGEGAERKNARKVLNLLKKGKHWVLVSLLLSNVITNETLPIVLDRSLGGGWPAVVSSTVLIVIFGEVVPQSVCVRFGLPIGAWCAPLVLALMWILSPVAWPTAKLLDYLLGEDHGTVYKKAGLKTLVTLHRTLGESPTERLNQDEVTIISAVLDLKDKPVGNIMTPITDVFTLSLDTVLDEEMMDKILAEGYSRIPIHAVHNSRDYVGMLLVKMLITYDPEDCLRVRDFHLATLPETRPETSCLDIVNFFQEGKSHMVLVSDYPGEPKGALGVLTLEDVIEELIGEEIVDESDVYIDVHKAIKRMKPAPFNKLKRVEKGEIVTEPDPQVPYSEQEGEMPHPDRTRSRSREPRKASFGELARSPPAATLILRRRSSGGDAIAVRPDSAEMRQHLRKNLGPSNLASNPKSTKIGSVKIKPGVDTMGTVPETSQLQIGDRPPVQRGWTSQALAPVIDDDATETTSLLNAGHPAKDGVHAVQYGALGTSPTAKMHHSPLVKQASQDQEPSPLRHSESNDSRTSPKSAPAKESRTTHSDRYSPERERKSGYLEPPPKMVIDLSPSQEDLTAENVAAIEDQQVDGNGSNKGKEPSRAESTTLVGGGSSDNAKTRSRTNSASTIGSLKSIDSGVTERKRRLHARSGSLSEQVVEVGGVKKIILEPSSSSDEGQNGDANGNAGGMASSTGGLDGAADGEKKKKKRKKRAGKKKGKKGEGEPLLGGED